MDIEKKLMMQEQVELTLLMPRPVEMNDLWFNGILQVGYMSFFSLSFPLAPIWGILINVVHINLFHYFTGSSLKRPLVNESENIGIWENILFVYSLISLIINTGILMFSCQGIFELVNLKSSISSDLYRITISLIIIENAVLLIKFLVAEVIPDCPKWVSKIKNNKEIKKEFLIEVEIKKKDQEMKKEAIKAMKLAEEFLQRPLKTINLRNSGLNEAQNLKEVSVSQKKEGFLARSSFSGKGNIQI